MPMNFRPGSRDEPEISLVAFIDVLLVVLIFLALSTTYQKATELQVQLPSAEADPGRTQPNDVRVSVSGEGRYAVNATLIEAGDVAALAKAMADAAKGNDNAMVTINADAASSHQAVIHVMDAARRAGLGRITFATQAVAPPPAPQTGSRASR